MHLQQTFIGYKDTKCKQNLEHLNKYCPNLLSVNSQNFTLANHNPSSDHFHNSPKNNPYPLLTHILTPPKNAPLPLIYPWQEAIYTKQQEENNQFSLQKENLLRRHHLALNTSLAVSNYFSNYELINKFVNIIIIIIIRLYM